MQLLKTPFPGFRFVLEWEKIAVAVSLCFPCSRDITERWLGGLSKQYVKKYVLLVQS